MTSEKPFIHLFKTPGAYYIYDVNKNTILKTQKPIFDHLQNVMNNNSDLSVCNESVLNSIKKMQDEGFLCTKRLKAMVHPSNDILPVYYERKLSMITLQVTQQCNFRCKYCSFSGEYPNRTHSSRKMSESMAKKGIDFLLKHSSDSEQVNIGFYGGEPLLEYSLIKKCIEYADSLFDGKKLSYSITTNGSLLNNEMVEYFIDHNVNLTISLDGPKDVHDKNRRFAHNNAGTFDVIIEKIESIKKYYPEYLKRIMFNVVLDDEMSYSCVDQFFMTYDTIKDSILTAGQISKLDKKTKNNPSESYYNELGYEMFKLYLSSLGKFDNKKISKLSYVFFNRMLKNFKLFERHTEFLPEVNHHSGPCVTGAQRLFMNVDGYFYPCERVNECSKVMKIGHVDTGIDIEKARKLLNVGMLSEEACINCWAFMYCYLCAAFADNGTELSCNKKLSHCDEVRRFVESNMKDYCTLREFGFTNEDMNEIFLDYEFEQE